MASRRKLTNKEKKIRAETKKRLQEEGIIPPDKQRLNRKKFIEEAKAEWNNRDYECLWGNCIMGAVGFMLGHVENSSGRVSLEAVGAAKILKIAIRLQEFHKMVQDRGEHEYKLIEQYNYIKDILEA